jgi:iron complex outermembrane recepter protein
MKVQRSKWPHRFWYGLSLPGLVAMLWAGGAMAAEPPSPPEITPTPSVAPQPLDLSQLPRPATTVQEWQRQIAQTQPQITNVRVLPTATGLEINLETATGQPLTIDASKFRREGNAFVAEIANARLALPSGSTFTAANPTADITSVLVQESVPGTVQVRVTGKDAPPKTDITLKVAGLAYALNPTQASEDEEVVVTGDQRGRYRVPNTTVGTKTDTPLRDIPQSIQIIPRQVLEDRKVRDLNEAIETTAGVVSGGNLYGSSASVRFIRGFSQAGNFRNGLRDAPNIFVLSSPIGVVEQIEVLRGPASVLFGDLEPGGIVNITTRQPQAKPAYTLSFEAGNRAFVQPQVDFTGPLGSSKVLYRFIGGYQNADGFQEFVRTNQIAVAPSITVNFSANTQLNLYYEFTRFNADPIPSSALLLSNGQLTPRNFYSSYPDFADSEQSAQRVGYTFTHKFNSKWQLRNSFAALFSRIDETQTYATSVLNNRFLNIESYDLDYGYNNYFGQIDLLGQFRLGWVNNQLLVGFDFNNYTDTYQGQFDTSFPLLDIRNPNYRVSAPNYEPFLGFQNRVRSYGFYVQNQMSFGKQIKLLLGGRYDWISSVFEVGSFGTLGNTIDEPTRNASAFSPRIGLVYQPIEQVSLYASYSRSFRANTGFDSSTAAFDPTRGIQYELGIKTDLLNNRLSATLAAYYLTKTNVATPDPNNPIFSIQTGEQRSQGIEFNLTGEVLPGWKVIASYAYTDAQVTRDNSTPVGNILTGVPRHQASLWTTYEIQRGSAKGLGFGFGLFYVGERQGDLANSFQVGDYIRADLGLYYRRNQFRSAINIRNLFNTDYVESSLASNSLTRGAPLTITGSISWEF